MKRDPETFEPRKPPDHYAWMADIPGPTGRVQRVALCATLPGHPPEPMASPDLDVVMGLQDVAQQAADNIGVPVTLYAFRGEEVLQVVGPRKDADEIVKPHFLPGGRHH